LFLQRKNYIYGLCDTQHTADWYAWANVEVVLTTWVDCEEVVLATTVTDENGAYLFSDVPPAKNYIITAICPEEIDFVIKDVVEELVEGGTYDAGIADAESTVLALCLEGLGEICLDSYLLDLNDFRNHSKYEIVICEVCDKLAECLHAIPVWVCEITELCPGWTPAEGEGEGECESSPTAYAGLDQEFQICTGDVVLVVDFTGSGTTEEPPLSYAWDFGDGGSSTLEDPSHTYQYPFSSPYTVTLTVTDECNNSATDETIVTVTECINHAPELVQPPDQAISADDVACVPTYKYTVVATDPDSDNLKFYLIANSYGNIPSNMVIDEDTGVITWTPECCDGNTRCHICCTECVKVKVEDDGCCEPLFDEMEFCIEIWYGTIDGDGYSVGIGFDDCPILDGFCN